MRKDAMVWTLALLVLCGWGALQLRGAGPTTPPSRVLDQKPETEEEKEERLAEEKYQKIIGFLIQEYRRIGDSKDWLTRGLTTISMARLPQSRANKELLRVLKDDPSAIVQLVAWECLMARSKTVDPEQFEVWSQLTPPLVAKNVFNGKLRVDLLEFMSMTPPDAATKKIFWKVFEETNSLMVNDVPVIEELGNLLRAWKSPDLVKGLLEKLPTLNDAYRAELVLHQAGCSAAWAGNRCDLSSDEMWKLAAKDYAEWWKSDKENWKEMTAKPEGTPWRNKTARYLSISIFDRDAVRANNPEVRKDLELGSPGLRAFDVMFIVDATESMQPPMDWLRGELRKMITVMGMMSSQPRIGITFYRDKGPYEFVSKTYPLTKTVEPLIQALTDTKALGGGDDPEAVKEGLADCFKNGGWDFSKHGLTDFTASNGEKKDVLVSAARGAIPGDPAMDPKVAILMGDAPPHPGTEDECVALVKKAAALGIKLYAVKLTTPLGEDKGSLPSFDAMAAAGNGSSMAADFGGGQTSFEFRGSPPAKRNNISYVWLARTITKSTTSQELLTKILLDAVNAKYKERIEMIVPLMLEVCEKPTPEVRTPFKAAPEPVKEPHNPGPHPPKEKPHQK